MRIRESLRSSTKSLLHNKLRSFLTMLGVIIGIFSVIMLTSIGEGVKHEVTSQVESLGANQLFVLPGKVDTSMRQGPSRLGVQSNHFGPESSTLTYGDALALKGRKGFRAVSALCYGIDHLDDLGILVSTTGVDEDWPMVSSRLELEHGRFFTVRERKERARVAVIGFEAKREIFGGGNPVGRVFRLNGAPYRVVGALKYRKPENRGPISEDRNVRIYLPITEILGRTGKTFVTQISVRADSAKAVPPVEKETRDTLRKRHRGVDFTVLKQQDILDTIDNIVGMLTAALGGIAAISLLVGGIGIMNIMLVSVAERTREIGVRKAIGARRRDILVQFLIEAMVLSVLGGLVGLAAGIGGSRLLPSLVRDIPTRISPGMVLLALGFALLVGAFFGVYPASKASALDPIEALRSE